MCCWRSAMSSDVGVVVVSSDRGLAGAYASTIIRMAEQRIIDLRREGKDVRIFAIGKKAQTYFRYRGYRIERSFLSVTDTPGYGDARAVANSVMGAYASGEVDAVEAFFSRFQSAMTQVPTRYDLLPIQATERQSAAPAPATEAAPPARLCRSSTHTSRRPPRSSIVSFPGTSRRSFSTCCSKPRPPSIPPVAGP